MQQIVTCLHPARVRHRHAFPLSTPPFLVLAVDCVTPSTVSSAAPTMYSGFFDLLYFVFIAR